MAQTQAMGGGRYGLRFKFIVLIGLLLIISGASLGWFFINRTTAALQEELKRRGVSLAKNLAYNSAYGVSIEDTSNLDRFMKGIVGESDVAYVMILDRQGKVLATTIASKTGSVLTDTLTKKALEAEAPLVQLSSEVGKDSAYDAAAPVLSQEERIGVVRVGLSRQGLNEKITALLMVGSVITILVITLGLMVSFFFVRLIVKPIEQMAGAAVKIADGDFTQTVLVTAHDEVGVLGETFSKMSDNLSRMIKQIKDVADRVAQISGQLKSGSKQMQDGAQVQASSSEKASSSTSKRPWRPSMPP